jgi:SAM-dependent methyltransferase
LKNTGSEKQFFPGAINYSGRNFGWLSVRPRTFPGDRSCVDWDCCTVHSARTNTRILDLGALFARVFDAHVVGVEPSTAMLAAADGSAQPMVAYVAGSGEAIPLRDQSYDLAWLSHVWHHIRDHRACTRELRRILLPGRHVLLRGTFGDQLDGFPTLFRFWPGTTEICRQLPTIQNTVAVFEVNGFAFAEHRRIDQVTGPQFARVLRANSVP